MKNFFLLCLLFTGQIGMAQINVPNLWDNYDELTDAKPHDSEAKWNNLSKPTNFSWASIDTRYNKLNIPDITLSNRWKVKAWKGERVNAQALIWTKNGLSGATLTVSDLINGSLKIPSSAIKTNFIRYVMTDELSKDGKTGCGHRPDPSEWDSSLVADVLDIIKIRDISACSTQPVWVNIWVPSDTKTGKYNGTLTISGNNFSPLKLQIELEVLPYTLPAPKDWAFHLDLWQNPYAVARYYEVPLWSKEHFDAMRPIMKMLADAGQKGITTSIMHKPWAGQTYDHFDSMITRIKKIDGSWEYDYTVFDKWVDFMINDIGINSHIYCYTMIPWALSFDYYDQATNRIQFVEAKPGDAAYEKYWKLFLKDFAGHLRKKGWFDKTIIAMDERGLDAMKEAIKVIRKSDPEFKISLAGNYHGEIQSELYDLCISFGEKFPTEVLEERRKSGKISKVYTCCAEPRPNTFTFSPPAEATWLGWHAMSGNYDGYLRWAYNSWTVDPLRDTRFHTWAGGDCFLVYPGGRSSIRFERLIEGIQDYEKVRLLREEFTQKRNPAKLRKLNDIVATFTSESITPDNAANMVNVAKKVLNSF